MLPTFEFRVKNIMQNINTRIFWVADFENYHQIFRLIQIFLEDSYFIFYHLNRRN